MRVILFRAHWIEPILQGRKVQTFRPVGKRAAPVAGEALSLRVWQGRPYRSSQRELLAVHCSSVYRSVLDDGGVVVLDGSKGGRRMTVEQCERFAWRDGFGSWEEMHEYFRRHATVPFEGNAISWD